MPHNYSKTAAVLNKLFLDGYFSVYSSLRYKNKKRLLEYMDVAYKRWYYSALVEGTIITPCLLFLKLNNEAETTAYTVPSIKNNDDTNAASVEFDYITYTIDDHPVVRDIKTFLDACVPFVELTEEGILNDEFRKTISNKLTMQDKNYADYFFNICMQLKLIKPMTSIYSNKAQVTAKAAKFLTQSKRELFDKIFNVTLDLAIINLQEILPPGLVALNKDYFLKLMKKPTPTDLIFKKIYDSLGLDISSFIERFNEAEHDYMNVFGDIDELSEMMLSSTYFLGILLDKYFMTPMGHYLKLIMPFYYAKYEYGPEFKFLKDELKESDDLSAFLWAPPSNYSLSPLGLSYFGVAPSEENCIAITDELPLDTLLDALKNGFAFLNDAPISYNKAENLSAPIYQIKVKVSDNKKIWAVLEFSGNRSLHDLHYMLCDLFYLISENDYTVQLDDSKSPFMYYVSPSSKKKNKKTDSVTLDQLALTEGQIIQYSMPNVPNPFNMNRRLCTFNIDIEMVKEKKHNPYDSYPFVAKKSKALMDFDEQMNADLPF